MSEYARDKYVCRLVYACYFVVRLFFGNSIQSGLGCLEDQCGIGSHFKKFVKIKPSDRYYKK